jgi:hypothetical protein
MKKIFKNGWWYLLFTFVVPFCLITFLVKGFNNYSDIPSWAQPLFWISAVPFLLNFFLGPMMQAYWRGNVSFRAIMVVNIIIALLGMLTVVASEGAGGPILVPGIGLWLWVWCGKVKSRDDVAPVPVPAPTATTMIRPPESFEPVQVATAPTGTVVPSRYYARLIESKSEKPARDHSYYY